MQAISQVDGEITCILNNMEKYISFSLIIKEEKDLEHRDQKQKDRKQKDHEQTD